MISIDKKAIDDPFYRYKMEKIEVSIRNKKTVLNNLKTICNTLKTEEKILFRFITKNLNTFGSSESDTYFISGVFESKKIQEVIYNFIDKYILCKKCKFPEISEGICKACGYRLI